MILATNFRQNIDDAFLRRLDFVVDFPFPEPEDRERIWQLVLPDGGAASPTTSTSSFLAERFKLSGGSIRNCSLTRRLPGRRRRRRDRDGAPRPRRRSRVRQARPLTLEADFERFHELIRPQTGTFPAVG